MKTPRFICSLSGLALLCMLATSCIKDEPEISAFSFSANPEWGVPIAFASISAERVINNFDDGGLVEIGGDGLVRIVYSDSLEPVFLQDFLQFPNQEFSNTIVLNDQQFGELVEQGSLNISETRLFTFDSPEGDRIDSLRFASGTFRLLVQSSNGIPVSGSVSILDVASDAVMYSLEFEDASPPVFIDIDAVLDNALLKFVNSNESSNGLRVAYDLNFNYGGYGINSAVQVDFQLLDFGVRNIGGFIAPRTFPLASGGLRINMFDNVHGAQIRVEDPRINFFFNNGFGIGAGLRINELAGSNPQGEVLVIPGSDIVQLPFIAPAPSHGTSASTRMEIDNSMMQPSITEFLAVQPNFVKGDFDMTINPNDDQSVFLTDDAELDISYQAEIPVYGSLANFNLRDTTDISLMDLIADVEEITEVARLDIRLFVDNGLPLDAALQIVFADSMHQALDSLFAELSPIFASAPIERNVGADHPNYGRATGRTRTIIDIPIPRERLLSLENASRMMIRVSGHTTGNESEPIRLFEQDKFDLHLGAKIVLNINE